MKRKKLQLLHQLGDDLDDVLFVLEPRTKKISHLAVTAQKVYVQNIEIIFVKTASNKTLVTLLENVSCENQEEITCF